MLKEERYDKNENIAYYIEIIKEYLGGIDAFVSKFDIADDLTDLKFEQLHAKVDLYSILNILDLIKHELK